MAGWTYGSLVGTWEGWLGVQKGYLGTREVGWAYGMAGWAHGRLARHIRRVAGMSAEKTEEEIAGI
jgi:hypothetical protein